MTSAGDYAYILGQDLEPSRLCHRLDDHGHGASFRLNSDFRGPEAGSEESSGLSLLHPSGRMICRYAWQLGGDEDWSSWRSAEMQFVYNNIAGLSYSGQTTRLLRFNVGSCMYISW